MKDKYLAALCELIRTKDNSFSEVKISVAPLGNDNARIELRISFVTDRLDDIDYLITGKETK